MPLQVHAPGEEHSRVAMADEPAADAMSVGLAAPVTSLAGVGPKLAERLRRLGVRRVADLLFHLPLRYQDRTRVVPIGSLRPDTEASIQGTVEIAHVQFGRRRSLMVRLADGTGALYLRFFHFSRTQQATLARGAVLRCYGDVRRGPHSLEMVHPEYRIVDAAAPAPVEETLTPIYPTTEGLHQLTLRKLTTQVLALLARDSGGTLSDLLPPSLRVPMGLPTLATSLRFLHRPPSDTRMGDLEAGSHPAQRRLIVEELLAHRLSLRVLRQRLGRRRAPPLQGDGRLRAAFARRLPYALTAAQQRASEEIARDLAADRPMLRLLQGDVGSGKTVVAALAALTALECGYQAAIMAPTELLAEQHQRNLGHWLGPLRLPVLWLSGKLKGRNRSEMLARIAAEPRAVVVGTHALFQHDVSFARLGLAIIDEQHRFGVDQRLALADKGRQGAEHPHQLIMTATPIPRTLAMTAYADLDTSVLDELPPNRQPVSTVVIADTRRDQIVARIAEAIRVGRQVYWVCTLIEESETLQCQTATDTAAALAAALPEVRVGLVHGRMKDGERDAAMSDFANARIDLLVATTVVEVGVDVPNASLMIVENAERLGLAQLHQLRGRVGRSGVKSDCVLLYQAPLSALARERLAVMRETADGFLIAQRDLELRGPGELLGSRQAGLAQMRIADLVRDNELLPFVARAAEQLLAEHPERVDAIVRRWLPDALHYGSG
ncbi:MAG: ATP-dependent DNA helicase RecG [Gammaproteobacteria bacterium]|nr:ATP-dependent DNA helicase RecG [Gammaproteobacteria bacterium]